MKALSTTSGESVRNLCLAEWPLPGVGAECAPGLHLPEEVGRVVMCCWAVLSCVVLVHALPAPVHARAQKPQALNGVLFLSAEALGCGVGVDRQIRKQRPKAEV